MTIAYPKKALPVTLAGVSFLLAGVTLWQVLVGDGYAALLGFVWFAFGGAVFLYSSRRPILHVRNGMLLTSGIAIPLTSIRAARIVRLWVGGPSRMLELRLSEFPKLSWHIRCFDRLALWRLPYLKNSCGYTPPPDPYYVIYLPETDLTDEDIVNAIHSPQHP